MGLKMFQKIIENSKNIIGYVYKNSFFYPYL